MTLRLATLCAVSLSFAAVTGCGGGDGNPDAATSGTDAAMTSMDDAAMTSMDDAAMTSMDDAAMTSMDDAGMTAMDDAAPMPDAVTVAASWGDVHAALQANCTPCHVSIGSGGHNMAQSNAMMAYTDSQLAAGSCAGLTKGACAAMRVRAATMPPGGLAEPMRSELAALIDGWVMAGQPAP